MAQHALLAIKPAQISVDREIVDRSPDGSTCLVLDVHIQKRADTFGDLDFMVALYEARPSTPVAWDEPASTPEGTADPEPTAYAADQVFLCHGSGWREWSAAFACLDLLYPGPEVRSYSRLMGWWYIRNGADQGPGGRARLCCEVHYQAGGVGSHFCVPLSDDWFPPELRKPSETAADTLSPLVRVVGSKDPHFYGSKKFQKPVGYIPAHSFRPNGGQS